MRRLENVKQAMAEGGIPVDAQSIPPALSRNDPEMAQVQTLEVLTAFLEAALKITPEI
jgi:hypothetical protein